MCVLLRLEVAAAVVLADMRAAVINHTTDEKVDSSLQHSLTALHVPSLIYLMKICKIQTDVMCSMSQKIGSKIICLLKVASLKQRTWFVSFQVSVSLCYLCSKMFSAGLLDCGRNLCERRERDECQV